MAFKASRGWEKRSSAAATAAPATTTPSVATTPMEQIDNFLKGKFNVFYTFKKQVFTFCSFLLCRSWII